MVNGLPDSDPLITQDFDKRDSFFKDQGLKSYKFIKEGNGHNMIVRFFETYENMKNALESSFIFERVEYC
ncbi:hypothetical protein RclHR1_22380002 [Rhizophagus clarus]|uniref:Uncharacterized protein n=1 Tax=Rhizophagus clarus TaxID=94130 RepID=A0A2Z6QWA2_9GLOM|nr:hypothetical protein RclHR1_22380002 [Rhizophagus clarus]GET00720.1 hypothetical protein RCL_e9024_RclHR1_22380002 [Rhizophagus clarus]